MNDSLAERLYEQNDSDFTPFANSNHYEHHKLKARALRTKEHQRSRTPPLSVLSPPETTSNPISKLSSCRKRSLLEKQLESTPVYQKTIIRKLVNTGETKAGKNKSTIGRGLFSREIQNNKFLGPGEYDSNLRRSQSFGYICKKQTISASASRATKSGKSLGPGSYNYSSCEKLLSRHRSSSGQSFDSQRLIRCILSSRDQEKIHLKPREAEDSDRTEMWRKKLGPGTYDKSDSSSKKGSSLVGSRQFTISRTDRIPIDLDAMKKVPGPGSYEWERFQKKYIGKSDLRKPRIEYKFVHGRPS